MQAKCPTRKVTVTAEKFCQRAEQSCEKFFCADDNIIFISLINFKLLIKIIYNNCIQLKVLQQKV